MDLGKCKIQWGDGTVFEGQIELIQHPPKYEFDPDGFLGATLDSLSGLSPESLSQIQRSALKSIEATMMLNIFGLEYYNGRFDAFDTLTGMGYKLNLVTGRYYKP